jgi:hypothetical protein
VVIDVGLLEENIDANEVDEVARGSRDWGPRAWNVSSVGSEHEIVPSSSVLQHAHKLLLTLQTMSGFARSAMQC